MKLTTEDDLVNGIVALEKEILNEKNPQNLTTKLILAKGFSFADLYHMFNCEMLEESNNYKEITKKILGGQSPQVKNLLEEHEISKRIYGNISDMSILSTTIDHNQTNRLILLMEKIDALGPKYDFLNVCFWGIQQYKHYISQDIYLKCYERMAAAIIENMQSVRLVNFSLSRKKINFLTSGFKYQSATNLFLNSDFGKVTINKGWNSVIEFEMLKKIYLTYKTKIENEMNNYYEGNPLKSFYLSKFEEKSLRFAGFNKLEERVLKQKISGKSHLSDSDIETILEGLNDLCKTNELGKEVFIYHVSEEKERLVKVNDSIVMLMSITGTKSRVIQTVLNKTVFEQQDYDIQIHKISDKLLSISLKDKTENKNLIRIEENVINILNMLSRELLEKLNEKNDYQIRSINENTKDNPLMDFVKDIDKHIKADMLIKSLDKEFEKQVTIKKKI